MSTREMTTIYSTPKEYRLLVGLRYVDGSRRLLQGLRTQIEDNPFHFVVTYRSFLEYTRRGIWFLCWASNEQLRKAEHLTFKESDSPSLEAMDTMLTKSLGGKVSWLTAIVPDTRETAMACLHAMTHGNPIAVRMLGMDFTQIFDRRQMMDMAEKDLWTFIIILYRRRLKMPQGKIWSLLRAIYPDRDLLYAEARKAMLEIKANGGLKIEFLEKLPEVVLPTP